MIRRPPRSTRTDTLFPDTTLFRSFWRANTALNVASDSTSVPVGTRGRPDGPDRRSEEHTSELQSLMRISYAVFCLKKKKYIITSLINYFLFNNTIITRINQSISTEVNIFCS